MSLSEAQKKLGAAQADTESSRPVHYARCTSMPQPLHRTHAATHPIASISISAPNGNPATCTHVLGGLGSGMSLAYVSFISAKKEKEVM